MRRIRDSRRTAGVLMLSLIACAATTSHAQDLSAMVDVTLAIVDEARADW